MKLFTSSTAAFVLGAAIMSSLNGNIKDIGVKQVEYADEIMPVTTTTIETTTETTTIQIYDTSKLNTNKNDWYFMYHNDHKTPDVQKGIDFKKYSTYYVGDTSEKRIYLTFDEGYENGYTPKILEVLKAKGVKAAFFCTGDFLKSQPDLVRRMVAEGHIVANHTYKHVNLAKVSEDKIKKELNDCEYEYKVITGGKEMPKFVRPPEGSYSEKSLAVAHNVGYKTIFWSFAHHDWDPSKQPGTQVTYNRIINGAHNGAIYLLHAVSKSDTEALPGAIDTLKSQGYSFGTLYELK